MYFGVGPKELFENNKGLNQVMLPAGLELFYKRKRLNSRNIRKSS